MSTAREVVYNRVDPEGTKEVTVVRQGKDRILVQVPGLQDPEGLKALLGKTARLEFKMVDSPTSPASRSRRAGAGEPRSCRCRTAAGSPSCAARWSTATSWSTPSRPSTRPPTSRSSTSASTAAAPTPSPGSPRRTSTSRSPSSSTTSSCPRPTSTSRSSAEGPDLGQLHRPDRHRPRRPARARASSRSS